MDWMKMVLQVILFCLAVLSTSMFKLVDAGPPPFWWLNTFLQQKIIGRYEYLDGNAFSGFGPCPDYGRKCIINFADLPQAVKDIGVSLPAPFDGSITLGQAMPVGSLYIYKLELSELEMLNITASGDSPTPSKETLNLLVQNFKFSARTEIQLVDIQIPVLGGFDLGSIDANISIAKSAQTVGNQVDLRLQFESPAGKTLSQSLPTNITVAKCGLETQLSLHLNVRSSYPFQDTINTVTGVVAGIVEPLLGHVICGVIKQLFVTFDGKPGLLTQVMNFTTTSLANISTLADPNVDAEELIIVNSLSTDVKEKAISFRDNLAVKGASNVINEFLGVPNGNPFVNEAVNLLSMPDNGTAVFSSLQDLGFSFTLPTPLFTIDLDLINITLIGLNTFQRFEILKNNYHLPPAQRDEYTLENRLVIGSTSLKLLLDLKLTDNTTATGGWIFRRPPFTGQASTDLRVELEAGLAGLNLTLFLTLVNEPGALHHLQIGQLLGKSSNATTFVDQAVQAGKCSSPAMHGFGLSFFELGLSDLFTPVLKLTPVDVGLEALLNNSTDRILAIVESAIKNNLQDISQHVLRPAINSIASEAFIAGSPHGSECPEYVSQNHKISPNFMSSRIFFSLSKAIRDVIGGNPVKQTAVSINQVIPIIIDFAIQAFGLSGVNTAPGDWTFTPELKVLPGHSFSGDSPTLDTSFQLNEIQLFGVDSVTKLLLTATGNQSLELNLELGSVGNPLEILFKNRLRADYIGEPDMDESFDVKVSLSGLKINVALDMDMDLNELYLLTLDDLGFSACLLAPFVSIDLDLDLAVNSLAIDVNHDGNTAGAPENKLRQALETLEAESSSPSLTTMINYVLTSVRSFVSGSLRNVSSNVINSTNCADQANAFDTVAARVAKAFFQVKNLTEVLSNATRPQPAPMTPAQADAQVFITLGGSPLDLHASSIASLLNDSVTQIPQDVFERLLRGLGDGSGDIFQDSFKTESDLSVSLDLNLTHFLPDGIPLEALISNATVFPRQLKLTNLTRLAMNKLRLVEPVSMFVTKTYVEIPGRIKLTAALDLDLPLAFKTPGASGIARESIEVNIEIDDLLVDVEMVTAINKAKLDGLSLASFFTLDLNGQLGLNPDVVDCIMSIIFPGGLFIPRLFIGLSAIRPTLDIIPNTFISEGTEAVIQSLIQVFLDFIAKDLKDFTQGGLRPFINAFVLEPLTSTRRTCTHPPIPQLPSNKQFLDFNNSEAIHDINHLLSHVLKGNVSNPYSLLNTVLAGLLDHQVFLQPVPGGSQGLGISDFTLTFKKALLATIDMHLTDVSLNNFGTIREMNLLEPRTNTSFYNELSIAGPFEAAFATRLHIRDLFEGYGPEGSKDELMFKLTVTNLTISTMVIMELNVRELLLVQASSLTNISQLACLVSPLRKLALKDFDLDVSAVQLEITCVGTCNSPYFSELQAGGSFNSDFDLEFMSEVTGLVVKLLVEYMNSDEAAEQTQTTIDNAAFNCQLATNLTQIVQIFNPPPVHGINVAVIFGLGWLGVVAGLILLVPALIVRHYQLKDKHLALNLMAANSEPGANAQSVAKYMAKAERDGVALAFHPTISTCCKVVVPVVCCINVALLIMSFVAYLNFEMSGSLYILGQKTKVVTLVPWFITNTINDMWNSGAWPLSLLVVFLSCAWPVIKNVLLFMIWYAPKHFLNHHSREWILVQMDILGKWSFLDIYVIVVFVGALRFSLVLADAPLLETINLPEHSFILDATVIPGTGIIMLCCAALASLAINHVIIWEMHKAEFADKRLFKLIDNAQDDMLTPKAAIPLRISDYVFSTVSPTGQRDRFGPKAKNQMILAIGVVIVWLFAGFFVPYFTFTYDGLVGIAIGFFIDGGRVRTLSIVSIGMKVMEASDGSASLNAIFFFFQLTYFVTVCVAPLLHLLLFGFLWLRPMTLQQAKSVFFFCKVAAYWAALEVFALAIVATTIEAAPLTNFLVDIITGNTCSAAEELLTEKLGEEDGACLKPSAYLNWGFAIIFSANMAQIGLGAILLRACGVAIRDREEVLEREPHKEWTWLEYLVLKHLMAHNIDHHKPKVPFLRAMCGRHLSRESLESKSVSDIQNNNNGDPTMNHGNHQGQVASFNPLSSIASCCDSCLGGVKDVSLTAPIAAPISKQALSKWNSAQSMQPQPQQSMRRFTSSTQQTQQRPPGSIVSESHLVPSSGAENPVFRMERSSRPPSVDV